MRLFSLVTMILAFPGCSLSTLQYFPEISGRVVDNGRPIVNAELVLVNKNNYQNKLFYTSKATTDDKGRFTIPVSQEFLLNFPHVHVAFQTLTIKTGNKIYSALEGKRDYLDSLADGFKLNMVCDISRNAEKQQISTLNGNHYHDSQAVYVYDGLCSVQN